MTIIRHDYLRELTDELDAYAESIQARHCEIARERGGGTTSITVAVNGELFAEGSARNKQDAEERCLSAFRRRRNAILGQAMAPASAPIRVLKLVP